MPPSFITSTGLEIQTVDEISTEIGASQRGAIDAGLDTSPASLQGNHNGIFASHLREAQEAIQILFDSIDPDNAEAAQLDRICAITGTEREAAKPSRFVGTKKLTATLQAGATITAGVSRCGVPGGATFIATETVTNGSGITMDLLFSAECEETGPIAVNANTVTEILTVTSGWVAVNNDFDAVLGALEESDGALRIRREVELRAQGSCTLESLQAALVAYEDEDESNPIRSAVVLVNGTSDYSYALGLAPRTFEAVIWDGPGEEAEDAAVCEIVKAHKPLTISSAGSETVAGTGARFSRATQRPVEIEITLRYDAQTYAGDAAVIAAVVALFLASQAPSSGAGSGIVAFSDYLAAAMSIAGVTRVTNFRSMFSGGAFSAFVDLQPEAREVAVLDSSDVTIISTEEL